MWIKSKHAIYTIAWLNDTSQSVVTRGLHSRASDITRPNGRLAMLSQSHWTTTSKNFYCLNQLSITCIVSSIDLTRCRLLVRNLATNNHTHTWLWFGVLSSSEWFLQVQSDHRSNATVTQERDRTSDPWYNSSLTWPLHHRIFSKGEAFFYISSREELHFIYTTLPIDHRIKGTNIRKMSKLV